MAEVALINSTSNSLTTFGAAKSSMTTKRKTPSELRGEQRKRRCAQPERALPPLLGSDGVKNNEIRRTQQLKIPKYINQRVNEIYPVKKSAERCRALYGDEKAKEPSTINVLTNDFPNTSAAPLPTVGQVPISSGNANTFKKPEASEQISKDTSDQGFRKIEKCSQNVLRNVVELHLGDENFVNSTKIDMEKALKGFSIPATVSLPVSSGKIGDSPPISSSNTCSEFEMPGPRVPLDFTLKTTLQMVSSSSVKWFHRLGATPANISLYSLFPHKDGHNLGCTSIHSASGLYSKSLHSWVYPQSSLPASVIAILSSTSAKGEADFLLKRQEDWEDSFRDLYYMFRKNLCSIFYVYAEQFVVLFIGGNFGGKDKHSCNAYLSQSTRGLRSLLKKHNVSFAMPLCHAEAEQANEDDMVELVEIEKRNLGKAFHLESLSDVDNTPQSLLLFSGNEEVHTLYNFLVNYRLLLKSLTSSDVPVLYAPVPFRNASSHAPEVRCREMRKADMVFPSSSESEMKDIETISGSSVGSFCYSIEVKDTVLPPWVVCGICAAMSSDGRSFESNFNTEPLSVGLNVALNSICGETDVPGDNAIGISEAVLTPRLSGKSLRRLKYLDGVYIANTTTV
ncbi:hypothetical protein Cni_G06282 [Canna indica]|uniref:Donson n=1 Tax=Canna indica TaxID=4628 RepID=A0AAQ3JYF0_9LILI|nr:hypothetical protein Cni_G06282 [Canna indica]